jgi:hypothetical protein
MEVLMNTHDIMTISQLAKAYPAFQVSTIRWWIYNSTRNGFNACIIRIGTRVYVDRARFVEWLESHRPMADVPLAAEVD